MTKQEFLDRAREKHGYKYQYPNLSDKVLSSDDIDILYNGVLYKQKVVKHILLGRCPEKNTPIKTTEEFMDVLKKSSVWREVKMLENFNADEFIKSFKIRGLDFFEMMDDIGKQMERKGQGLPSIDIRKTPKAGMRHLIQGWDYVLQLLNREMVKSGVYKGKLMDFVPQKAMDDPYEFFKFFERRFHKKADRFKRKLYRIGSLVTDKSLMS